MNKAPTSLPGGPSAACLVRELRAQYGRRVPGPPADAADHQRGQAELKEAPPLRRGDGGRRVSGPSVFSTTKSCEQRRRHRQQQH